MALIETKIYGNARVRVFDDFIISKEECQKQLDEITPDIYCALLKQEKQKQ